MRDVAERDEEHVNVENRCKGTDAQKKMWLYLYQC